ncbi:MAG: hypothetical protein SGBAC_012884, partial [Bacillariaceae sp.]
MNQQNENEEEDPANRQQEDEDSGSRQASTIQTSWRGAAILLMTSAIIATGVSVGLCGKETESNTWNPKQQRRRLVSGGYGPQKLSADMVNPRVLNVHVVPHTHDDVGWLKTVEQYYYGLNNTIQGVCVKDILDSVVASLLEDESRTFTYVETKFFSMWWNEQTDAIKDSVRYLVASEQLSFTNGAWCMHDEAATHFMGMIDQTTLGHEFLKRELGVVPK